ncbi:hypothetical protein TBLA_0B06400 [Henningerozyma blattae CBS 6284]|uniref:Endoplasmic reticulum-Golgi intermediate compartment protein n=1 Tax=Henningerozyma blattae (strain ATCC 34711 / CBS 6284 / DSM 70876 / NBRC 10599 / NRRL Y-10934 / UCD 77-7) TaxID=1071380 RepID=I2GZB1_HENB6|nr:hypothetical protein TBLA_0B06400 [Tetrapisispora blattae CBS 6284]CCH59463.1 hypothetical protein TBLA_0B06400 [Tetrapisispora blattae CBS 6284]
MAGLKTFDAFPKTDDQHIKKSKKVGLTSILTYFFLLLITWTEFGNFFGGYIDQQYIINNDKLQDQVHELVHINLDIYIKLPCKWLDVNSRDITGDHTFVSNYLTFEDMPFFIPYGSKLNILHDIVTPNIDQILGEAIPAEFREKLDTIIPLDENGKPLYELDGCHVFGQIPVNRVQGELQFTAKGYGYMNWERTPYELINFDHVINEFSFGNFFPYIDNPLDNTAKINLDDPVTSWIYDTSVVPSYYRKLGAEVDTFQYSVSQYSYNGTSLQKMTSSTSVPGIFFKYDFEALSLVLTDHRISFFQFLIRLVAILSFVVYTAAWLFRLLDKVLIITMGPKWSLRYQPAAQSQPLLD